MDDKTNTLTDEDVEWFCKELARVAETNDMAAWWLLILWALGDDMDAKKEFVAQRMREAESVMQALDLFFERLLSILRGLK